MSQSTPPPHADNAPDLDAKLQEILTQFEKLSSVHNSIHKEYQLYQIANAYHLPVDTVRQMFKSYCRQQIADQWKNSLWRSLLWKTELCMEWLNGCFSEMDIFQVLEYASKLSVLIGVFVFMLEIPQRAEQKATEQKRANYEAWRVITSSEGKAASGGRIDALQDLNQQKVSLAGINLVKADLSTINLKGADLPRADLSETTLYKANLNQAVLQYANLKESRLRNTQLKEANMIGVNLREASLYKADLTQANLNGSNLIDSDFEDATLDGTRLHNTLYSPETRFPPGFDRSRFKMYLIQSNADLRKVNLEFSDLSSIDLHGADLRQANLKSVNLSHANLSQAKLEGADLDNANLSGVNLAEAIGITPEQIQSAENWQDAIYDNGFRNRLGL